MRAKSWLSLVLVTLLLAAQCPQAQAQQPENDPAVRLLERMSPAARVGQLFIVTFPGTDTSEAAAIHSLIMEDRIGGVLLRPQNGNIVNEGDTPTQVAALTNSLQQLSWEGSQSPSLALPGEEANGSDPFIPLIIAVEQEGDGPPHTAITNGTTPLPSLMAIGATWKPEHAEAVGAIVGQELSAMGINLLLGPSLDVLDTPRPDNPADLGVRSFGGDPYWVGRMGTAYVRGVHTGSGGRVGVVPGHFPGLGAADRPLSEEVSTVQKSLEQLKQIELAPFFAVADSSDPLAQADGLLISHIRYRGFQGNIYQSTKPISFDPQALQQLMNLPELAPWRDAGGVTVADELGVRAVSRFYDPTEQEFMGLRIAREAFVAGNDLLILSHFALTDDWESQINNVRATVAFFRERYDSDPTFQTWVDEAVLRILRMKLRLYGSPSAFTLSGAQVNEARVADTVGQQREEIATLARDGVTLLSPPSPDLRPSPPAAGEYIVIFTDDRQSSPCATCSPTYVISPTLLSDTLIRLYGPQATGQVQPYLVQSFTFSELMEYLNAPAAPPEEGTTTPTPPNPVETAIQRANWILFAMLDANESTGPPSVVSRFLAEQTVPMRDKDVAVFAFGAPYYLDTTEISKLSAYFGLYSHTEPFVEAAARALFDEFPFVGASPVSVSGINYNLITQTQPDPDQIIEVFYEVVGNGEGENRPQPTPQTIEVHQSDTLRLWTSTVMDQNGHPVPDGTPVEFIFTYPQEGLEHTVQSNTRDGVAETTVTLDRVGQLQVSVRAEPVPRAIRLEMSIPEGEPAVIVQITPTPTPTPSLATPTPTIPAPTPEVTPTPSQASSGSGGSPHGRVDGSDLMQGILSTAFIALVGYTGMWRRRRNVSLALRGALWCAVGGLVAYIGLALGLPGFTWLQQQVGTWAAGALAALGAGVSLFLVLASDAVYGQRPTVD